MSEPRSASERSAASSADDERWAGVSDADRAALEIGLRMVENTGDAVTVVTVGPASAEHGLRAAIAAGAARAVRVDSPHGLASDAVARAIASHADETSWVVCGDVSADRGTGSVPAYLAAELGAAQALGLVAVTPTSDGNAVRATRRLDGGRREVLLVPRPAVLSVEGSVARLRRSSLPAALAARSAPIEQFIGPSQPVERADVVHPYRPRPRVGAVPTGDALERVQALTDVTGGKVTHTELVALDPPEAADRIIAALAQWGYLGQEVDPWTSSG